MEIKTKPTCLICNESVSVLKEYNIKRHNETKHANKFNKHKGQFRQDQANDLKKFSAQQKIFTRAGSESTTCYVKASYAVAMILAKNRSHIQTVIWLRNVWRASLKLCPEMKKDFSTINLFRQTITRRVDDIGKHIEDNLKSRSSEFIFYAPSIR